MNECHYKHIAIIKLSALGDIVHTLPSAARMRRLYPGARISWIVESAGAKLLENFQGIDEIIPLNLKKREGVSGKLAELRLFLQRYRHRFDLILDFQGLIKSAMLGWMLRGRRFIGFHGQNLREPLAGWFYHESIPPFDEERHVVMKNLHLVSHLESPIGVSVLGDEPPLPVRDLSPWRRDLQKFFSARHLQPGEFMILNVGGGWPTKILSLEQLMRVAATLVKKYPLAVLWGTLAEKETAEAVCRATGAAPADFFSFPQLLLFIQSARLLITGDTLPLHLADLVQTPSVAFFGPTSPQRNGSRLEASIAICENSSCHFCYKRKCGKIDCFKNLNLEAIIQAAGKLYEKSS